MEGGQVTPLNYESPLLPIPEIVECFRESNIHICEQDLSDPNPRRWHEIYSNIYEMLALRPIEQVIQSLFKIERTHSAYPELFEEGFAQMAFTICLRSVLSRFGFQGFCIRDVIQPAPKRLQRISSIFINAVRHLEHRRLAANEIFDRIDSSRSQYEAALSQNKNLKAYLAAANETRPQREAELQKLQAEYEPEQQSCRELLKIQEEERRTIEEYKLQLSEFDAEKENLKQQLGAVTHQVEKISNKIVQSPKRFKKDLEWHKKKVEELKSDLAKKEQSLSENKLLLEQTANKLRIAEKAVKLAKEVSSDQDEKNELMTAIQRSAETRQELKELYSKYCMQEEDVAEKLGVREEQKHKLSSQIDVKDHALYQQITDHRQHQDKQKETVKKLEMEASQVGLATVTCYKQLSSLEKTVEEKKAENEQEIAEAAEEALLVMEILNEQFQNWEPTLMEDEDQ